MKSIIEHSIKSIIKNYSDFFFNKKNVVGVGLGHKVIKDVNTGIPSLHVFVENKKPLNNLYKHEIIPNNFLNITTDVIETGKFSTENFSPSQSNLSSLNNLVPIKPEPFLLQERFRPLQAGYSISPSKSDSAGTLGAIVFDNFNNTPYILSNNHVLCNYNKIKKGTSILQPAKYDAKPIKANKVAKLSKWIVLEYSTKSKISNYMLPINWVDCAIAEITLPPLLIEKSIRYIGNIKGTFNTVSLDEQVQKLGRTTGYTTGTVTSIDATLTLGEKKKFRLGNQILTTKISEPGDSGSLVLNFSNKAIGLLCGSNEKNTIITPIERILKLLNVHFEV
ncbi:hypothetical protein [Clostridium tarantellae]|uniref:Serine protease n=1 Tax=Clostridium tarantellae TaxID=39493 RepID=A0A6I1MM09_9CLOT|nr:hypothetical protein [Clostridium tarantellae]MPQ44030.1 hypothetical protein [Clostridium tarantellae]